MKAVCLSIVLLVCFLVVYYKIYRREQFMKKVKTASDINYLEQDKNYLIQDEEFFLEDLELFYKDSNCKKRKEKIYIKAKPVLLKQIAERYDGTEQLVFPMVVKIEGEKVSVSEYEEIWSGKC